MQLLKDKTWLRWTIMVMVSLVMFASYYFTEVPSTLKAHLEKYLEFSSSNYGLFVGLYSYPNIILAAIGGLIIDKIGIRKTGLLFIGFMVIGAFLTTYGASEAYLSGGLGYNMVRSLFPNVSPSFPVMSLGFFFYGLGGETSIVLITVIVVKWFKGKELATAMGLNVSLARLGAALSGNLSPRIAQAGIASSFMTGSVILAISLLIFIIYITLFDIKIDKQLQSQKSNEPMDEFRLADIVKLLSNRSFVLITVLCVAFYSAFFPFSKYAADYLTHEHGFDPSNSGDLFSILHYLPIVFTPLFGLVMDKKGKGATLMIFGSILLIATFLLMAFIQAPPIIWFILISIAFSLVPSAMWPAVSKIVDEKRLGTAYGVMFSLQQAGVGAFVWLIGYLLDVFNPGVSSETIALGKTYDYTAPLVVLSITGLIGLIFAFLLKINDRTSGYGLEQPNKKDKEE